MASQFSFGLRAAAPRWAYLFLALALAAGAAPAKPAPALELKQATLAVPGASQPLPVSLPYQFRGAGVYTLRLAFEHDRPPEDLGVFVTATNMHFSASANGRLVHQTGGAESPPPYMPSAAGSPSFRIPAEAVLRGSNVLELTLYAPPQQLNGIGGLLIGPAEPLRALAWRHWLLWSAAPLMIAAILTAVGLVSLVLRRGRRCDVPFFWLGSGSLAWGVLWILYQLPEVPLPQPHFSVLIHALWIWFPMLLAIFFMRFAERSTRLFEAVALGVAFAAFPGLYLGVALDAFEPVSISMRALMLVIASIALVAVLRYALSERTVKGTALALVGGLGVLGGAYDWYQSLDPSTLKQLSVSAYSGVLLVVLAGWMLLNRYHAAFEAAQRSNVDLEKKVRAANVQLQARLAQVQAARDEAEQASAAKSRFLAAASHDLRQPLHSLGLFAAALDTHVAGHAGRELLRHIEESIDVLKRLFDQMLDLSRIDAGQVAVDPRNVPFSMCLTGSRWNFTPRRASVSCA
jgi:signal transduction histidine kinase